MTEQENREAFEKAFKERLGAHICQFDIDEDGNYEDRETLCAWHMWNASTQREGYKLVPIEPSEKMKHAGYCALFNGGTATKVFKAMISEA